MLGILPKYSIYPSIFLLLLLILFIVWHNYVDIPKGKNSTSMSVLGVSSILAFLFLYWGARPFNFGADTPKYVEAYRLACLGYTDYINKDIAFTLFTRVLAFFDSSRVFLLAASFLISYGLFKTYLLIKKASNSTNAFFFIILLLSGFWISNLYGNIVRVGISISFFYVGYCNFLYGGKKIKSYLYFIISVLFHLSLFIPVIFLILNLAVKRIKIQYFLAVYIITLVTSAAGFGLDKLPLLEIVFGERATLFLSRMSENYRTGFRVDFALFNTFFLFVFYKYLKLENESTSLTLKMYICTSCVFFSAFGFPYSDRLGLLSWIFIPILLYQMILLSPHNKQFRLFSMASILFFLINTVKLYFL